MPQQQQPQTVAESPQNRIMRLIDEYVAGKVTRAAVEIVVKETIANEYAEGYARGSDNDDYDDGDEDDEYYDDEDEMYDDEDDYDEEDDR